MSPVAAVCPEHGPIESQGFSATGAKNVRFVGSTDVCRKCGREAQVMEGRFDFDADGFATVLAAPTWSKHALKSVQDILHESARVLADTTIPDVQALKLVEAKLTQIADNQADLAAQLVKVTKGKPRRRMIAIVLGVAFVLGLIADIDGTVDAVSGLIEWAVERYEAGNAPRLQDVPSLPPQSTPPAP